MEREESNNNNKQHFSHKHILTRLQLDEVEEITCNACECDVEEEQFYGCTDCKYFLHEECAEAPRSIEHRSHPSHPLTLHAAATYSNQSFICDACGYVGPYTLSRSCDACGDLINAFAYQCDECDYKIHVACALLPETVQCKGHVHSL
ncbi:PREDICTED: uncharacterized protein LOC105969430 [Erythranthe guttata]|uniref:uncharacterized protein LOC105969430 n=1 Tax=Erythranthe guttata TaxID=4155 RepID=UPI00064DE41C|nr:PREDICTED: uncharacterized protein LOC105969430 [Erythranthe guttata]|eukprot:XP_012849638.1 PREDICTED: uncharacterized protein LOC105969430 [Erythranthe guttata]